jgi:predicted transcriptional regulator
MKMIHRARIDILADILYIIASQGGITKAKIHSKAFMTYTRLRPCMLFLLENDFVKLQAYEGIRELIDSVANVQEEEILQYQPIIKR